MKTKYLLLFACLLVVLVVLYIVQQRSSRIQVVETGWHRLLPDLDTDKVARIRLRRSKEKASLVMERISSVWRLPSYFNVKANEHRIRSLLQDLRNLKGEPRASGKELFPLFGLNGDKELVLELLDEKDRPLTTLLIGKRGPAGQGCFVRIKNREEVYLADKNLPFLFGIYQDSDPVPKGKPWADLRLISAPEDSWKQVEISWKGGAVRFEREKTKPAAPPDVKDTGKSPPKEPLPLGRWVQRKPAKPALGEKKIRNVLDRLARVRAAGAVDPSDPHAYGLDAPAYRVKIVRNDGSTLELKAGRPGEKRPFYVQLPDKSVYEVPAATWEGVIDLLRNGSKKK